MGDVAARVQSRSEDTGPVSFVEASELERTPTPVRARKTVLLVGREDPVGEALGRTLRDRLGVYGPVAPMRLKGAIRGGPPFEAAVIDADAGDAAYDAILQLSEAEQPCRSVVLGSQIDRAAVREAFLVGVVACLRKPVETKVLEAAVRRAIDATMLMRRCIMAADRTTQAIESLGRPALGSSLLTPREQEILELLREGRSTRKMAERLSVSERTIKFHVSNLLRKFGAGSRISLLAKLGRGTTW